jgi:hypothetical protein
MAGGQSRDGHPPDEANARGDLSAIPSIPADQLLLVPAVNWGANARGGPGIHF